MLISIGVLPDEYSFARVSITFQVIGIILY